VVAALDMRRALAALCLAVPLGLACAQGGGAAPVVNL